MRRLDLDGLPCFFVEAPEPGFAALVVRSGVCDEPAHLRGISHLVEHLALFPVPRRPHDWGGFVDLMTTVFWVAGTQAEREQYLADVVAGLDGLPYDRLETERRVLRAEAANEGMTAAAELLEARFGFVGYGGHVLKELGLRHVGPDDVEAWRCRHHVRENAALWVHGAEPPSEAPALPHGTLQPLPPLQPKPRAGFPGWRADGSGRVVAGLMLSRTWESTIGLGLLRQRLWDRLRGERGLVYEVFHGYERLGDRAHGLVGTECSDADALSIAAEILEAVDRMAEEGPTGQEVSEAVEVIQRGWEEDPHDARVVLDAAAFDHLVGAGPSGRGQLRDELVAVTPDSVRENLARAASSLLLIGPAGTPRPREDLADVDVSAPAVDGRRYKPRARRDRREVVVDQAGVLLREAEEVLAIPAEEIACVVDEGTGQFTVIGQDGSYVQIAPEALHEGDDALATLRRLVPLFVPSGDERPRQVRERAERDLEPRQQGAPELSRLPRVLAEDERPLALAFGSRGLKEGLLAVTARRLLWLRGGDEDDPLFELERGRIEDVESRKALTGPQLRVVTGGETLKFSAIEPTRRADALASALATSQLDG